jgi:hypothetical protein
VGWFCWDAGFKARASDFQGDGMVGVFVVIGHQPARRLGSAPAEDKLGLEQVQWARWVSLSTQPIRWW